MVKMLCVRVESILKKIPLANGTTSEAFGIKKSVPISFEDLSLPLKSLVISNPHLETIIALPALKSLHAFIDLGTQTVTMKYG